MLKRLAGGAILMVALEIQTPSVAQAALRIGPRSFALVASRATAQGDAVVVRVGNIVAKGGTIDPDMHAALKVSLMAHDALRA